MTVKNPTAAPTEKQIAFYNVLAAERDLPTIDTFAPGTNRQAASEAIEALKGIKKTHTKPAAPTVHTHANATPVNVANGFAVTLNFPSATEAAAFAGFAQSIANAVAFAVAGNEIDTPLDDHDDPAIPTIPDGKYAIHGDDGTIDFYNVETGKTGKWDGFVFLSHQQSDTFVAVKEKATKAAILAKIAADPLAAAKLYGTSLGVCGICGKTLTDPESIAAGIGPVCAKKF